MSCSKTTNLRFIFRKRLMLVASFNLVNEVLLYLFTINRIFGKISFSSLLHIFTVKPSYFRMLTWWFCSVS